MKPETFKAWAILLENDIGTAGRYYFDNDVPEQFEGCRCALFDTRKVARKFCDKEKLWQKRVFAGLQHKLPKVIRVEVTVKAI